jgi:hypothetical protein
MGRRNDLPTASPGRKSADLFGVPREQGLANPDRDFVASVASFRNATVSRLKMPWPGYPIG